MSLKDSPFMTFTPGTKIHIMGGYRDVGKSLWQESLHYKPYTYKGPMPCPVCEYTAAPNGTKPETFTIKILKNREFPRRKVSNAIMELEV